jgi:ribosomal-protein-alanine N-acetyltransferase
MNDETLCYRNASYADHLSLCELERSVFSHDRLSSRQIAYHLKSSKNLFLVCTANAAIVGYILIFLRSDKKYARIYSLAVAAEKRGRGIANVLVEKSIAYCQQKKVTKLFLEVSTKNSSAIALYNKHHFKVVRTILDYYENGEDAFKMMRSNNL